MDSGEQKLGCLTSTNVLDHTKKKTLQALSLQRCHPSVVGLILLIATVHQIAWFVTGSLSYGAVVNEPSTSFVIVNQTSHQQLNSVLHLIQVVPRYAYAFIISGCDPQQANYRDYIYNILVAARNLRQFGSKADFLLFLQISWKSNHTVLPFEDERVLRAMNIAIRYIPKHEHESFYRTMMDKFRVLGLTEYDRVLLLDGDVMPMGNLDYLFHMSQRGILRQNLVVQGESAPANGGFFMVRPGGLDIINEIIQRRQREAREMGPPYFNATAGWGHVFHAPDDTWASLQENSGMDWTFYGAIADQGLLYYWVKYVQKDVSVCYHNGTVQNWHTNSEGKLVVQTLEKPFVNYSNFLKCWGEYYCRSSPMQDYIHFYRLSKPWLQWPPDNLSWQTQLESAVHFWFWQLKEINDEHELGLQFSNWSSVFPSLGFGPTASDIVAANVDLLT